MDEQADEYTSDASWYGWLDQWHDDYPQPQDNNKLEYFKVVSMNMI